MRFGLLISAVLFSSMSFAGQGLTSKTARAQLAAVEAQSDKCFDTAVATNEMKQCSYAEADAAGAVVKSILSQLRLSLNTSIAQGTGGLTREGKLKSQETLERLNASQKTWEAYIEAQCFYDGSAMLDGSEETVISSGCLAKKNVERAAELLMNLND